MRGLPRDRSWLSAFDASNTATIKPQAASLKIQIFKCQEVRFKPLSTLPLCAAHASWDHSPKIKSEYHTKCTTMTVDYFINDRVQRSIKPDHSPAPERMLPATTASQTKDLTMYQVLRLITDLRSLSVCLETFAVSRTSKADCRKGRVEQG